MAAELTEHEDGDSAQLRESVILLVVALYASVFVVFGFLVDPPADIARGLVAILTSRDKLRRWHRSAVCS